jgi:hypothetical protein
MLNDCWLRCEAPLMKSEGVPYTVTLSSTELGTLRRDPQCTLLGRGAIEARRERGETALDSIALSPFQAKGKPRSQSASAMGQLCECEQAFVWSRWGATKNPAWPSGVARFGVNAFTRLAHTNRAHAMRDDHAYEVQETDGVDPSNSRRLTPPSGTGAPALSY